MMRCEGLGDHFNNPSLTSMAEEMMMTPTKTLRGSKRVFLNDWPILKKKVQAMNENMNVRLNTVDESLATILARLGHQ